MSDPFTVSGPLRHNGRQTRCQRPLVPTYRISEAASLIGVSDNTVPGR